MTEKIVSPSALRRLVIAMAGWGLDLRPLAQRARNLLLRPVRHELSDERATVTALLEQLRANQAAADARQDAQATPLNAGEARLEILAIRLETAEAGAEVAAQRLVDAESVVRAALDQLSATERNIAAELDQRLGGMAETLRLESHARSTACQQEQSEWLVARNRELRQRLHLLERLLSAGPRCTPVEQHALPEPLVSVVLPTFNRAMCLSEAIDSVRAQTLGNWELIVVDDGSEDGTSEVLAAYSADTRIRHARIDHSGSAAARNAGLRMTRGALIAHLDSDNLWYPDFLGEAVRALQAAPDVGLVYGVLVTDAHGLDESCLLFAPFDHARLQSGNYIDLNTVVHRRELVERHGDFDEKLTRLIDWDLLLRFTAQTTTKALPTLAARYRICDRQRITDTVPVGPNWAAIRTKLLNAVPPKRMPRVLYVVWHYPQLSETYVEGELRCMRRCGAQVEVWRNIHAVSPYPSQVPVHDGSLAEAVRLFRPDVIHVHWLSFALTQEALLADIGVPITIRMHGFDVTAERLDLLLRKPWLHKAYAFPGQLALGHFPVERITAIPVAFETALFKPQPQKDRLLVVRTGAALPSKDISLFFELAKRLPQFRFVFAGVTCNEFEHYVDELRRIHAEMQSPAELLFDVSREEVASLVAKAGLYVHTIKAPGMEFAAPIGMPISIVEAMATGAHVLVRDEPQLRSYVGTAGSVYRDAEHAARIIAGTLDWTERQWNEAWMASVDRAFMHHADDVVLRPIFEDWCELVAGDQPLTGRMDATTSQFAF